MPHTMGTAHSTTNLAITDAIGIMNTVDFNITVNSLLSSSRVLDSLQAHILLVDDEIDIAQTFQLGLEQAGFHVDYFRTASEAVARFRPDIYDILLLDIKLPDMSGFELYDKLRIIDVGVKVCFITAFGFEYNRLFKRLYKDLNPHCFIQIPVVIEKLVRIVRIELGLSDASASCSCEYDDSGYDGITN